MHIVFIDFSSPWTTYNQERSIFLSHVVDMFLSRHPTAVSMNFSPFHPDHDGLTSQDVAPCKKT